MPRTAIARFDKEFTYGTIRRMKNLVILISGRGTNMRAIIEAAKRERWDCRVCAVISSRADAAGLLFAAENNIPTRVVASADFTSRTDFDAALHSAIEPFAPELIILAGFMRILTDQFVNRYRGRMINIHPSLLPSFTGLATHRQALDAGVRIHGATVHFVTPDLDHGPIIAQTAVPVLQNDTAETLRLRVLEQEHKIYPEAVRWFVEDRVELVDGLVHVRDDTA